MIHKDSIRSSPMSFALIAGLALSLIAAPTGGAATFTVNIQSDSHDSNPGDGVCSDTSGLCSLRAAIEESNAMPEFPPEIIILPSGTYTLTLGVLEITSSLNLNGTGADLTIIDGNRNSGIFLISNTGANPIVQISAVTICNAVGNINFGTGVRIAQGSSLLLANSVVCENADPVGGVGIGNFGFLTLFRSTVRDNQITGGGGGVTGTGAGLLNGTTGVAEIIESTISNNTGIRGGGISNSGSLDILNSTISGNKASVGGGIRNTGVVNISFSTITDNEAGRVTGEPLENRVGGGIVNFGQINIGNSILAGNRQLPPVSGMPFAPPDAPPFSPDGYSVEEFRFTSFRGNVVGIVNENLDMRDTIFGDTRFDQVGTEEDPLDPRLEGLNFNGGPTMTHALLQDSPAIDQGTGVTSAEFFDCPETDQRLLTRPAGMECDVGAFEFGSLLGDLNGDSCVSTSDLLILTNEVRARSTDLRFDINGDGKVDIADARFLVLNFTNPRGVPCP